MTIKSTSYNARNSCFRIYQYLVEHLLAVLARVQIGESGLQHLAKAQPTHCTFLIPLSSLSVVATVSHSPLVGRYCGVQGKNWKTIGEKTIEPPTTRKPQINDRRKSRVKTDLQDAAQKKWNLCPISRTLASWSRKAYFFTTTKRFDTKIMQEEPLTS